MNVNKIISLEKELYGRPEYKVLLKLEELQYTINLFDRNFEVLIELIKDVTSSKYDKGELMTRPNYYKRDFIFMEMVFRLHNFVASAKSLCSAPLINQTELQQIFCNYEYGN